MSAKRIDGLIVQRMEGEVLAIRESTQEAHALNETAAIVFDLCDGETSAETMAGELARRTGLPADPSIVQLALADLEDAGLVSLDAPVPTGLTRRSLLRQLTLSAAMVAILPVVETILLAPSRASAQAVPCTACTIPPTYGATYFPSPTPTPAPTYFPSPTPTPAPTYFPSPTPTPYPTYPPTHFPSPTPTPFPSPTPTPTPVPNEPPGRPDDRPPAPGSGPPGKPPGRPPV